MTVANLRLSQFGGLVTGLVLLQGVLCYHDAQAAPAPQSMSSVCAWEQ